MNLDLPSITAFALEGSGAAALALDEVQTLTLAAPARSQRADGLAPSRVKFGARRDSRNWPFHAAVVPGPDQGLTITF